MGVTQAINALDALVYDGWPVAQTDRVRVEEEDLAEIASDIRTGLEGAGAGADVALTRLARLVDDAPRIPPGDEVSIDKHEVEQLIAELRRFAPSGQVAARSPVLSAGASEAVAALADLSAALGRAPRARLGTQLRVDPVALLDLVERVRATAPGPVPDIDELAELIAEAPSGRGVTEVRISRARAGTLARRIGAGLGPN